MKVSVIIPYDEDRGFLKEAVASCDNQTFTDFEVIIQKGNFSLGKNINIGIQRAKGEWIKILAEDDLLTSNCLKDLYEFAYFHDYDWVCADAIEFSKADNYESTFKGKITNLPEMLLRNQIHGATVLYKKSMLIEVGGFDEKLWTGEEYDMSLLLLSKGYKLGYMPEVVSWYRLHSYQKSSNMGGEEKKKRKQWIKENINSRYL